ncbi:dph1 [Scenedesmus sp. PABB004]|nr:dph1 [Scenedesmus sp. PABB004]
MADDGDAPPQRFSGSARAAGGGGALVPHAAPAAPAPAPPHRVVRQQQVPDSILQDPGLAAAAAALPGNYNFEVPKTVWRVRSAGARVVALQFPEGLLMYACVIADILTRFAGVAHALILGDVTFGACCVDDLSAAALGADLLVHYGHSCLVPLDVTVIPCLYVFVDIAIDVDHLVDSVRAAFPPRAGGAAGGGALGGGGEAQEQQQAQQEQQGQGQGQCADQQQQLLTADLQQQEQQPQEQPPALVLAGTIQFSSAVQLARARLAPDYPSLSVPKCRPLSPGEVLGCTAPVVTQPADALVFVADGRFHLEAMMIANPRLPAFRYDPYGRRLTRETYDQAGMRAARRAAIAAAAGASRWGLVLGTLGRQGNPRTLELLRTALAERRGGGGGRVTVVLLSEVTQAKLGAMPSVEAWVQVACPRLSIDWGEGFAAPVLTPYEALVALRRVPGWWEAAPAGGGSGDAPGAGGGGGDAAGDAGGGRGDGGGLNPGAAAAGPQHPTDYPMDYYARDGGAWSSSYHRAPPPRGGAAGRARARSPAARARAAAAARPRAPQRARRARQRSTSSCPERAAASHVELLVARPLQHGELAV